MPVRRHHAVAVVIYRRRIVLLVLAVYWALQSISPCWAERGACWYSIGRWDSEFSNDFHQLQVALRMDDLPLASLP